MHAGILFNLQNLACALQGLFINPHELMRDCMAPGMQCRKRSFTHSCGGTTYPTHTCVVPCAAPRLPDLRCRCWAALCLNVLLLALTATGTVTCCRVVHATHIHH